MAELHRKSGGTNYVERMVSAYLSDSPRQIQAIREALPRGDATTVNLEAHVLKGTSATIGADQLRDLCARLGKQACVGDIG